MGMTKMKLPTVVLRIALVLTVCGAQFYTSFRDIVDAVLPHVHDDTSRAISFPISIDAAILAATLYASVKVGMNRKARLAALFVRYTGCIGTLYANALASGITRVDVLTVDVVTGTLLLMLPAILLIGTVEMVIHAAQGTPASRKAKQSAGATTASVSKLRAVN